MSINPWQLKLAAWTHDPAEKALILMRDRVGHEGGTVKALQQTLFGGKPANDLEKFMKKADHWAAAADRPNFPGDEFIDRKGNEGLSDRWSSVRFYNEPVLIHPLSGENFRLDKLKDAVDVAAIKAVSFDHFNKLIQKTDGAIDHQKTALAFWRFGPHLQTNLGALWELLPADTRVPDHSIWSHLDLTAAFATGMALSSDENPALLSMSFGPVQDFIAQFKEEFKSLPPEEVAFPRGINGLKEYSDSVMLYKKGTPIHVRGAILFNHMMKEKKLTKSYPLIQEGEKLKFTYLKQPNTFKDNVISYPVRLPKEFGLHDYIDYDLQFEKAFIDPIKVILDCVGWTTDKKTSLEDFFS